MKFLFLFICINSTGAKIFASPIFFQISTTQLVVNFAKLFAHSSMLVLSTHQLKAVAPIADSMKNKAVADLVFVALRK